MLGQVYLGLILCGFQSYGKFERRFKSRALLKGKIILLRNGAGKMETIENIRYKTLDEKLLRV